MLKNSREIVFIPTGGVRGMGPVTKLISSRDDILPYVLLDSDKVGNEYKNQLINGRYKDDIQKVLSVAEFLGSKEYEIEDLLPARSLIYFIDRQYRSDQYFEDYYITGEPIVNQIEFWAIKNSVVLGDGWKMEIARILQNRFEKLMESIPEELEMIWIRLFTKLTN